MNIVMIISGIIGIWFGTQFNLMIQFGAVIAFYVIMESPYVRAMEIGAIFPYLIGFSFLIGIMLGDISWAVQTNVWDQWNFSNPFKVN